jgi:2-(3-amino-3-carboxypropyl)histidine synthase
VLYVFVEILFDPSHLISMLKSHFDKTSTMALMGTIQFVSSVFHVSSVLKEDGYNILVPQCKPLSPAETLGCTSPILASDCKIAIFVADGRFHLESAMIQNPTVTFYRYDPYAKVLSSEGYDIETMKSVRL